MARVFFLDIQADYLKSPIDILNKGYLIFKLDLY